MGPHDEQCQSVECFVMVGMEWFHGSRISVIDGRDFTRPSYAEMDQVVSRRAQVSVFVLHSHRYKREVIAVRLNHAAIRQQLNFRRRAGGSNFFASHDSAVVISDSFESARLEWHLPHKPILGQELAVRAYVQP